MRQANYLEHTNETGQLLEHTSETGLLFSTHPWDRPTI